MPVEAIILIVAFVVLLVGNVPVAFALTISTLLAMIALADVPASYIIAQRMAGGIDSFPLLAIPFFVLAGVLMGEGGMARRLIDFAHSVVGPVRGGLAFVNTLTCMMFGAISGSAAAAVSSIGGFMIPEMNAKGYDRDFNVALTTTSATTGLLIPPSNIMIIYAVVAQQSIAALFIAGILPGIVVGVLIMIAAGILCTVRGYGAGAETSFATILRQGVRALPSLGLVFIIMGGILGGQFSATESSAVAVAYALILATVFYREVRITDLPRILLVSGKTTAIVMLLIGSSQAMSWFLAYEQIPQSISSMLLAASQSRVVILLIINALLLVVGMFMDMTPAVLIFTPIFLPVTTALGIHPIHFGIVMIVNLCIGLCTPPVGTCLFLGCSVGRTTIARVSLAMIPFYVAMLLALAIITYVPWISMALPEVFGYDR
ncbi:MAG TPA: TRAP transporter large permease [Lacipirellulaceae bacterium]|nr:TRAP transporter large permease [Lacipirellulaceae bacterium]